MRAELVIGLAQKLGIQVTRSPYDSELFECWADRVVMARVYDRQGDRERLAGAIADANGYAVNASPARRRGRRNGRGFAAGPIGGPSGHKTPIIRR